MAGFSPFSEDRDTTGFVGQSPRPQQAAPVLGAPDVGGSASTPFSPLFDPSRRDAFGLIGRIMGNPSQSQINYEAEAEAARAASAARAPAFEALRESIEASGGDVPRGVMNFLNTPEGVNAFISDPDFVKNLSPILNAIKEQPSTASAREEGRARGMSSGEVFEERSQTEATKSMLQMAEMLDMSPGDFAKAKFRQENLTAETREMMELSEAAGMSPEETKQFFKDTVEQKINGPVTEQTRTWLFMSEKTGIPVATIIQQEMDLKAAKANGPSTAKERFLLEAETRGLIGRDTAVLIGSGALTIRPRRDQDGTETGDFDVINLADGTTFAILNTDNPGDRKVISSLRDVETLDTLPAAADPLTQDEDEAKKMSALKVPAAEAVDEADVGTLAPVLTEEAPTPDGGTFSFPSADLVDGAGIGGAAQEFLGGFLGNISPRLAATLTTSRRNQLRAIALAAQNLADKGSRLKGAFDLVNDIATGTGLGTNPADMAQKLLDLHAALEAREATNRDDLQLEGRDTPPLSKTQRQAAEATRTRLSILRNTLPTKASLQGKLEQLLTDDPNALLDAARSVEGGLEAEGINVPGGIPPLDGTGGEPAAPNPDAGASNPVLRDITTEEHAQRLGESRLAADARGQVKETILDVYREILDASNAGDALAGDALSKVANAKFPGTDASIASVTEGLGETMRPAMVSATRVAMGFNIRLAEVLGAPVDAVNEALVSLGSGGFLDETGDATAAVKEAFQDMGFTGTGVIDTLEGEIGSGGMEAALHAAVLFASAGTMAAAEGTNVATVLTRELGRLTIRYPGLTGAQFIGAGTGAPAFTGLMRKIAGRELGPTETALSELTGGILGGGAATIAVRTGADRLLAESLGSAVQRGPLANVVDDLTPLRMAAQRVIERERGVVNNEIKQVIEGFSKPPAEGQFDPVSAARNTVKQIQNLKLRSDGVERKLWDAVNTKGISVKGHTGDLDALIKDQVANAAQGSKKETLPMGVITKLTKLVKAKTLSAFDLQAVRGDIRALYKDPAVRNSAKKAANSIDSEIIKVMQRAAPDRAALMEATEYSVFHNAKFRKGVIGDIVRGGQGVREEGSLQLVQRLVRSEGGGEALEQTAVRLNSQKALKAGEASIREEFGQIAANADEAAFAKAAESGGAQSETPFGHGKRAAARLGSKFLNNPQVKRFMKAFPQAKLDADQTIADLSKAVSTSNKLDKSAWAKFSDKTPEEAVGILFGMKDSGTAARAIRLELSKDPAAARAFDSGVLKHFFSGKMLNEATPALLLKQITNADTAKTLTGALGGEKYRRLVRLVQAAEVNDAIGGRTVLQAMVGFGRTGARFAGALFGRSLGTGTIQVPQIMSQKALTLWEKMWSGAMAPEDLLARAISNPTMEKLLLSRVPDNLKASEALKNQFRKVMIIEQSSHRLPQRGPSGSR